MKLFHHPVSSSARRVNLVAAHLGLTLDEQLVDLRSQADRAALRELNPNEKIPVLVDGDLVLWESHAIMQYLCERTPGQTLYPSEPRARADVNRWLFWIANHLSGTVGAISFERLWKKLVTGGDADPAVIARHEALFHPLAALLDRHLATRAWLSGDAPTLADYSLASTLMYADRTDLPLAPYRHLRALLGRVHELPAWAKTTVTSPW
jgi:glutathione S-transferase